MIEEWIIRGLIGVVAAVSGAIARPWIQDWLREQRRRRFEQRGMVDEWLGMMGWRMLIPASAILAIERGRPARDAARDANQLMTEWIKMQQSPTHPLAPGRLSDRKLGELIEEMTNVTDGMILRTSEVAKGRDSDGYAEMLRASANRIEELRDLVNRRVGESQL